MLNDTLLLGQGSKYDSFNSNSDRQKRCIGTTMGLLGGCVQLIRSVTICAILYLEMIIS